MEPNATYWISRIFASCLWEQTRFRQIERLLGTATGDMKCLLLGGSPGMHAAIHQTRGAWSSLAFSAEEAEGLRAMGIAQVVEFDPPELPFDPDAFDRIVLVDVLEHVPNDRDFIKDCHRILKDSGILILNAVHRKRWGLYPLVRRLLGMAPPAGQERAARGYNEAELFDLLKDGFDVQETHSHSRFFLETAQACSMCLAGGLVNREKPPADSPTELAGYYHRIYRVFSMTRPLVWVLSRLDYLMFAAKGYQLTARAKKRMWRPRKTPILRDGRSIAEATLGAKIGSALEY